MCRASIDQNVAYNGINKIRTSFPSFFSIISNISSIYFPCYYFCIPTSTAYSLSHLWDDIMDGEIVSNRCITAVAPWISVQSHAVFPLVRLKYTWRGGTMLSSLHIWQRGNKSIISSFELCSGDQILLFCILHIKGMYNNMKNRFYYTRIVTVGTGIVGAMMTRDPLAPPIIDHDCVLDWRIIEEPGKKHCRVPVPVMGLPVPIRPYYLRLISLHLK